MTVTVDDKRCIGCGMCAAAVPEVFQVIGRVSTVLSQPAKERFFRVLDAANGCPVNAIQAERLDNFLPICYSNSCLFEADMAA